jgi:hypothetical protein
MVLANKPQIDWTPEHEKILIEWADKAMCYRWLHSKSNAMFSSLNAWYTIPVIIISTLTGTANFAQERVPIEYQSFFVMIVGAFNITAGIITTIQQFLKITQLNEAHRVSSIAWDKFYRNIKIELCNFYAGVHIDSTITPLREGLVMLNASRVNPQNCPRAFDHWEKIWVTDDMIVPQDFYQFPYASKWIAMNMLVLDPETVIIDAAQTQLINILKSKGIDSIPLTLSHSRTLGGGFHCVTLDTRRKNA